MHRMSSLGLRAAIVRLSLAAVFVGSAAIPTGAATAFDVASWTGASLGGINPKVFALALESASSAVAQGLAATPATLTVIDYSMPSTERRMWVFDVRSHALLFREFVSHGRGSGKTMATAFSNVAESN